MRKRKARKLLTGFLALLFVLAAHHGLTQEQPMETGAEKEAEVVVREVTIDLETMGLIWIQEGNVKRLAYVVQTGDTLWDIAARYLNSPYYWPKIWERNTFVINPHLIFPGDIIYIYPEGLIQVPDQLEGATIPVVKDLKDVKAKKRQIVHRQSGATGFISKDQLESAKKIIDSFDPRTMLGENDIAYVNVGKVDRVLSGDRYSIFRVMQNPLTEKIVDVKHPVTGGLIGYQILNLGELVLTNVEIETSEAHIENSYQEIHVNDLITPYLQPLEEKVEVLDTEVEVLKGYIVANKNNVKLIGSNDIVYIDLGAEDGVMRGNQFTVYKPCEVIADKVTENPIRIPEKFLGLLVVLEPHKETSICLVIDAKSEIVYGEHILMSKYSSWEIGGISQAVEVESCERDPKCRLITKEEYESGMDIPFCEARPEGEVEASRWRLRK
jgi:hypothetical protein